MEREARFAMLQRARPDDAAELAELAQRDVDERWHVYEQLAEIEHEPEEPEEPEEAEEPEEPDAATAKPTAAREVTA
jgi:hypothetical protein